MVYSEKSIVGRFFVGVRVRRVHDARKVIVLWRIEFESLIKMIDIVIATKVECLPLNRHRVDMRWGTGAADGSSPSRLSVSFVPRLPTNIFADQGKICCRRFSQNFQRSDLENRVGAVFLHAESFEINLRFQNWYI